MKYLLKTLLIFAITFLILNFIIFALNKGHEKAYNIGNFKIKETLSNKDNYYFEITHEKFKINFSIKQNYNKAEKVLTKLEYKKIDNYNCIFPIFKNKKILTDVMCLKNGTISYAHDLENKNIQNYLKTLKLYDKDIYEDKADPVKLSNTVTIYEDNLLQNHYIAMETYKGLNLFGGSENSVKIFEADVYKKPISYFTDKYYIVADYKEQYSFKIFHVINIVNGKQTDIRSYDDISFDSYIMGALGDDIYLFDKDANVEYKISLKNETVEKFADKDNLKTYNGKWKSLSLNEALNGTYFNNYHSNDIKGYEKVDKVGNYYYLYQKENDYYNVYRADRQNKKLKTYLFKTTSLNNIIYLDDAIYYLNGDTFYYYNNASHKVITNSELQFNDDISFGAYKK